MRTGYCGCVSEAEHNKNWEIEKKIMMLCTEWWNCEDIAGTSVLEVTNSALTMFAENSVFDRRFGAMAPNESCATCGLRRSQCPGHFGHVRFAMPCFHPYRSAAVFDFLKKTCLFCGKGTCGELQHCPACQYPIGKLRRVTHGYEVTYSPKQTRQHGSVLKSSKRLIEMDELMKIIPPTLLLRTLPVPPFAIRPSVPRHGGWTHDALSHHYVSIVKLNEHLITYMKLKRPRHVIIAQWHKLQTAVSKLFDSNDERMPGLRQRLDGKQGRFRKHLQGKRVDFSARTVITGDPSLDLDEVGVPQSIAMRLSIPERVTRFNRAELQACIERGAHELGGALYVIRADETRYDLQYCTRVQLNIGDTVERMLRDGDHVVMNRQPTLHRMSMMAHRVKILPGSTFRLNLAVTSPYNAVSLRVQCITHTGTYTPL